MHGLESHKYAPNRSPEGEDPRSLVEREAKRIADMVHAAENIDNKEDKEAAIAAAVEDYEKTVERLASSEESFDIEAFHEQLADEGVVAERTPEAAPAPQADAREKIGTSPRNGSGGRKELPYSDEYREHVKGNVKKQIEELEAMGLAGDRADEMNRRADGIQAPEDTKRLLRELRALGKNLSKVKNVPPDQTPEAAAPAAPANGASESVETSSAATKSTAATPAESLGDVLKVLKASKERIGGASPQRSSAARSGQRMDNDQPFGAKPVEVPVSLPSFYRKREQEAILAGPAQKDAPTLDVILHDPKLQDLFGEFMKLNRGEYLVVKYHQDPASMTLEEQNTFRALRLEFANRMALAEESASHLTLEDLAPALKAGKFGLFGESLRPEVALQRLKERCIPRLFIRESEDTIYKLILSQRALQGIRSGPRRQHYLKLRDRVMRRTGTSTRPEHLDPQVLRHVMGKSMLEWLTYRGPGDRHSETLNDIQDNINSVMDILAASVTADPEAIRDAAREAESGKAMPAPGGAGEASYAEMEKKTKSYNLAEEQRAFNVFKQNLRDRRIDTNNLSFVEEANYYSDFVSQREAAHGRNGTRRGWFSIILDAFFSAFFMQNLNQFKFKEA